MSSELKGTLSELRRTLSEFRHSQLSHERFDRAHEHFEGSSDQQGRILAWLQQFSTARLIQLSDDISWNEAYLRVLSVGCGSGILDNPLIRTLSETVGDTADRMPVRYTGVDPNPVACNRFRQGFERSPASNVDLTVLESTVEALGNPGLFDLIHAVHSLYYFANPANSLQALIERLHPRGDLVIFQAPKAQLNQLADCFWVEHTDVDIWFSDDVARYLKLSGMQFDQHRIDAHVDVTSCFDPDCAEGRLILDFITQTDCERLGRRPMEMVLVYLRAVGKVEADRILVPHPVDVFVVKPQLSKGDGCRQGD